ncbi:kinase-like domain-containing protein [Trametes polyzona]|nr:kinase-like domain-containing protein [Trametes polyzona]
MSLATISTSLYATSILVSPNSKPGAAIATFERTTSNSRPFQYSDQPLTMVDRSDITCPLFPDIASVKTVIAEGKVLAQEYPATVVEAGDLIIKYGPRIYKSEALALQFVRDIAIIPAPRLHAYFSEIDNNGKTRRGYLVMEKMPGTPLLEVLPRLDDPACDRIAVQLRQLVSALRSIASDGRWGVFGRNGVYHRGHFHYLHRPYTEAQIQYGNPCVASSARDVLDYFAKACDDYIDDEVARAAELQELYSHVDFSRPSIFSHGDLVPENILVDESGSITGLIDWEYAGWYPYFWDSSIARIRHSAYQDKPVESQRWRHIAKLAIEDDSEAGAVDTFCTLFFDALFYGRDTVPGDPCSCCF